MNCSWRTSDSGPDEARRQNDHRQAATDLPNRHAHTQTMNAPACCVCGVAAACSWRVVRRARRISLKVICALTCLPRTSPRASPVVRKVQVSPIVCMNSNNCDLHFVQIRDAPNRCEGGPVWDAIILRCIRASGAARLQRSGLPDPRSIHLQRRRRSRMGPRRWMLMHRKKYAPAAKQEKHDESLALGYRCGSGQLKAAQR